MDWVAATSTDMQYTTLTTKRYNTVMHTIHAHHIHTQLHAHMTCCTLAHMHEIAGWRQTIEFPLQNYG